jgi:riboflavin synthase
MFTGIVATTGRIEHAVHSAGNMRLTIGAAQLGMDDVAIGDSIAVDGVCLTVVEKDAAGFCADVSQETLDCSRGFTEGAEVNLEKSLRFGDRVGGHLVSGHVDGVGSVGVVQDLGASWRFSIEAPALLARYIARKGSITVNGVSLTVNQVDNSSSGCDVEINVIPHTLAVTTLHNLTSGSKVNLEVDLMARYIERMLPSANPQGPS